MSCECCFPRATRLKCLLLMAINFTRVLFRSRARARLGRSVSLVVARARAIFVRNSRSCVRVKVDG